jgi:hypothetical protein
MDRNKFNQDVRPHLTEIPLGKKPSPSIALNWMPGSTLYPAQRASSEGLETGGRQMSKRNQMPGLRLKNGIGQIEKRCKYCESGWLRESTGTSSRAEAEEILIHRLAELREETRRKALSIYTFEEAAMRYLEEIAHKASADRVAIHLDQLLSFIGDHTLAQVHDGTLKAFIDHERARRLSAKSVNNALAVVSAVLNRAARVWRSEAGTPWLQQAPPRLTRLSLVGQQAKP